MQPGSLESEASIYALAFDKSSTRLISAECDKSIKIWQEDSEATEETHPINFNSEDMMWVDVRMKLINYKNSLNEDLAFVAYHASAHLSLHGWAQPHRDAKAAASKWEAPRRA